MNFLKIFGRGVKFFLTQSGGESNETEKSLRNTGNFCITMIICIVLDKTRVYLYL